MENKRIVLLAHFYRAAWSRWNSIESTDAANIWSLSKHWQIDNIGHRLFKRINQHEAPSDYHLNGSHYHCSVYNVSYSIWQAQLYRPSGHFVIARMRARTPTMAGRLSHTTNVTQQCVEKLCSVMFCILLYRITADKTHAAKHTVIIMRDLALFVSAHCQSGTCN